ncbi:MAG: homoserine dehydrogenase [Deltaproteobacteria bacterium]
MTLRIGLLGAGVVGSGLLRLIEERGAGLEVRHIAVRDRKKAREHVPQGVPVGTVDDVLNDPDIDVVVELMGGIEPALTAVRTAMGHGRHVVTANKALVAEHGAELARLARQANVAFRFEASVAGCLPIVEILQAGLVFDRVDRLFGILNGTCNFILTSGQRDGRGYREALAQAQELGFAEADPTLDVSGMDTAQKLSILASLLTNQRATIDDLAVTGIEDIRVEDHRAAEELGYRIKLLGLYRAGETAALRVAPTLVGADSAIGLTTDEYNVVEVECRYVGWQLHLGKGAGSLPTAAAVLHDLERLTAASSALAPRDDVLALENPRAWRSKWLVRLPPSETSHSAAEIGQVLARYDVQIDELRRSRQRGVGTLVITRQARAGDVTVAARHLDPSAVLLGIEPEA